MTSESAVRDFLMTVRLNVQDQLSHWNFTLPENQTLGLQMGCSPYWANWVGHQCYYKHVQYDC